MSARLTVYPGRVVQQVEDTTFDDRVEIAESIVADAQGAAPIDTGYYRSQMAVESEGNRVFAVDTADDAVFIEYGTLDTDPAASVTNAARQYGKYSGWEPRS